MLNKIGYTNGYSIYSDEHMEENLFLRGRKENSNQMFIIANPKLAKIIYDSFRLKNRKKKLEKINSISEEET